MLGATLLARKNDVVMLYNELGRNKMNVMYPEYMRRAQASILSGDYGSAWSVLTTLVGEAYRTTPDRILDALKAGKYPAFAAQPPESLILGPGPSGEIPKWAWVAGAAALAYFFLGRK